MNEEFIERLKGALEDAICRLEQFQEKPSCELYLKERSLDLCCALENFIDDLK